MSIKRRIWALPIISSVILTAGLGVNVIFVGETSESITKIEKVNTPVLTKAKSVDLSIKNFVETLKDVVAEGAKDKMPAVEKDGQKIKDEIASFKNYDGKEELANRLTKEFNNYYNSATGVAKVMLELDKGDPTTLVPKMQSDLEALQKDLEKLNVSSQAELAQSIADNKEDINHILLTNIVVSLLNALSIILISYVLIRTLWKQLGGEPEAARNVVKIIASGDLTAQIPTTEHKDSLLAAMSEMQSKLSLMISDIRASSLSIKDSSREIASGNMDLSSRTESQAGSLEETASAMEELTSTVKQNADNAQTANQLVISSSQIASKGGEVVKEVVDTMELIKSSSGKIADIVSVIDSLAFQTNLLALNAAVEAARAGEQGRGFAVVASEVRNLAHRSAQAAKEIKGLIENSTKNVENGSKLVTQAGETMNQIMTSVRRVEDIVNEISLASQEQSRGLEEVNQAIIQMDSITQQNAALVEESAASANMMQMQSEKLYDSVSIFKVDNKPTIVETKVKPKVETKKVVAQIENKMVSKKPVKTEPIKKVDKPIAKPLKKKNEVLEGDWEEF